MSYTPAYATITSSTGTIVTWDDTHKLYIINSNIIGQPVAKTTYVEIPGGNGFIDLSDAVAGQVVYSHREINVKFAVDADPAAAATLIKTFRQYFQGKKVNINFSFFSGYWFRGRAEISEPETKGFYTEFTLKIPQAEPYAYTSTTATSGVMV